MSKLKRFEDKAPTTEEASTSRLEGEKKMAEEKAEMFKDFTSSNEHTINARIELLHRKEE